MNKQASIASRQRAQGGFTLIELIVVIVILGILAATALPKFINLGGDARAASINAAGGALKATVALARGQVLAKGSANAQSVQMDGAVVNLANGYPAADQSFLDAAGISATDYKVTTNATGNVVPAANNNPAIPANGLLLQPVSVVGTASGSTCFVTYAAATVVNNNVVAPLVNVSSSAANCQ